MVREVKWRKVRDIPDVVDANQKVRRHLKRVVVTEIIQVRVLS
jgi:hypothetical protein